jgi:hypothetical protein
MPRRAVAVPSELPLGRFVVEYVYAYHYDLFPVVSDRCLVGIVAMKDMLELFSLKMDLEWPG